jgi:hypothetical protein
MATHTAEGPAHRYNSNPFELLTPAWEAFKLCWTNILLLMLAFCAFVLAVVLVLAATGFAGLALGLIGPVVLYAVGYMCWALTKVTISAARGKKLSFKAALPPTADLPLKYLATMFLVLLAFVGGLILLIIPGIIFVTWFSAATYITVDEGVWGVAALKRSRELTRGRVWDTLGAITLVPCFGVLTIVPVLGDIAYMVAAIVLIPLFAVRYTQLIKLKKRADWQTVPTSGWNYAIAIVGLLVIGADANHEMSKPMENNPLEKNVRAY